MNSNDSPDLILHNGRITTLDSNCPEATNLVKARAASYPGLIAISSFIRAFSELKQSGEIVQLRQPKSPAVEEPELTPEAYRKLSARETARRYLQEPDFKIQVDSLISRGLI